MHTVAQPARAFLIERKGRWLKSIQWHQIRSCPRRKTRTGGGTVIKTVALTYAKVLIEIPIHPFGAGKHSIRKTEEGTPTVVRTILGSSKGRTAVSETVNVGSNPTLRSNHCCDDRSGSSRYASFVQWQGHSADYRGMWVRVLQDVPNSRGFP